MKKIFLLLLTIAIFSTSGKSQQDTVYATRAEFMLEIKALQSTLESLRSQIRSASSKNRLLNESVLDLSRKSDSLGMAIYYTKNETDILIDSLEAGINRITEIEKNNRQKLEVVTKKIDNSFIYFIGAMIIIISSGLILFFILRKNILNNNRKDHEQKLNELIKQNNQTKKMVLLHEVMANLPLKSRKQAKSKPEDESFTWIAEKDEKGIDHSLANKIGKELSDIKIKLGKLGTKTPELSEFEKMIKKLEKEFIACGYTIENETIKYKNKTIKQLSE